MNLDNMFFGAAAFNGEINGWQINSGATVKNMFVLAGCGSITTCNTV